MPTRAVSPMATRNREYSARDVARREKNRSQPARNSDSGKRAKERVRNTAEGRRTWSRNPSRYDMPGLDGRGTRRERSFWDRLLGR